MAGNTPFQNDKKNAQSWVPKLATVLGIAAIVLPILGALAKEFAWNWLVFAVIGLGVALLIFSRYTKIGKGGIVIGNDTDTSQL